MNPKILLVEDHAATRFGFVRYFSREGYDVREAATLAEATAALAAERFDALILDVNLPDGNGIEFISAVRANDSCIPIIIITAEGNVQLAVEAMQQGADNFLLKPVDNAALAAFLRKTLEVGVLKRQASARQRLEKREEMFFDDHPALREIYAIAEAAATSDSPVLISGETGTGKGMLAKWIHRHSPRAAGEFVEVNCSGLRGELLSREIFGNIRGAFTSADQDRKGLLDIADRGVLFLDEIGDMGLEVQAQFLKVLEDKSYRRLGDVKLMRSDFRLLCATNRAVEDLVQQGLFRQDLLYRINLVSIHIPPLRERRESLPALVAYLLRELGAPADVVSPEIMTLLQNYGWPGNIRELKNVLERALLLTPRGALLRQAHFSLLGMNRATTTPVAPRTVQDLEASHIMATLDQLGGDVERTAQALGLSRATLYRRLKQIKSTSQPPR